MNKEKILPESAIADLGKITDKQLSEKHGVSLQAVAKARKKAGIARFCKCSPFDVGLMGTMTDAKLAKTIGTTKSAIVYARLKRNIPAFSQASSVQKRWTEKEVALLGTMTDRQVAVITGRTMTAVLFARRTRKIRPAEHVWSAEGSG